MTVGGPRVAVVGVGAFGRNHARVYSELQKQGEPVELAAVCDANPERAAAQMGEHRRGIAGAGAQWTRGGGQQHHPGQTVWVLEDGGTLKPAQIRTGITDGHFTQVVDGDLKPGDNVIVGLATSKVEGPPPPGSSNPMGGRGPGGGGRRPGGG